MVVVAVALVVRRVLITRRPAGQSRCAGCGHQVVAVDSARCGECGRDLGTTGAVRWDRQRSTGVRIVSALLAVIVVVGAALVGVAVTRHRESALASRLTVSTTPLAEVVRRTIETERGSEASAMLNQMIGGGGPEMVEAVRAALVEALGADRLSDPTWYQTDSIVTLVRTILTALGDDGGWAEDPSHPNAKLLRRAIGSPRPAVRTRHRAGSTVMVGAPGGEPISGVEVAHRIERVLLDGDVLPLASDGAEEWSQHGIWPRRHWFTLPSMPIDDLDNQQSRQLRIEWRIEVRPARRGLQTIAPRAMLIHREHEQRLEFVAADAPTIEPTSALEHSPWGESIDGSLAVSWHVEIVPVGDRQAAGAVIEIPGRPRVRVDGTMSLEQDGRSVRIGAPVAAVDPAHRPNAWQGAVLVDPPFDLARPIVLRFQPQEPADNPYDLHDYWWAEPFEIALRPDAPIRTTLRNGRVIWWGGAEARPAW